MTSKTNYWENKVTDLLNRGQTITMDGGKTISVSATINRHYALGVVDHKRENSLVVALNDTVAVNTAAGWRLYSVTTAGTLAVSQPAYPGANDEVITDGTATLTEQYTALEAGTAFIEPTGADYARSSIACNMVNFSGTQAPGSTTASTGTDGTIENNVDVTFPDAVTAAYTSGFIFLFGWFDASIGGNLCERGVLSAGPIQIGLGSTGNKFGPNGLTIQEDN